MFFSGFGMNQPRSSGNPVSKSTGGSARNWSSTLNQPTAPPQPSTDLFDDSALEELPNQRKPPASQPRVKQVRSGSCT